MVKTENDNSNQTRVKDVSITNDSKFESRARYREITTQSNHVRRIEIKEKIMIGPITILSKMDFMTKCMMIDQMMCTSDSITTEWYPRKWCLMKKKNRFSIIVLMKLGKI
jgi:hypothetical protein